jgi:hypothetical protein
MKHLSAVLFASCMPSPPLTYDQLNQAATEAVQQVTETLDAQRKPIARNDQ